MPQPGEKDHPLHGIVLIPRGVHQEFSDEGTLLLCHFICPKPHLGEKSSDVDVDVQQEGGSNAKYQKYALRVLIGQGHGGPIGDLSLYLPGWPVMVHGRPVP